MPFKLAKYLALLTTTLAASSYAGFWDSFLRRDVNVITVTDVTKEGESTARPTAEKPAYYIAVSLGFHDFGPAAAGERVPPSDAVIKHITKVLAKEHYMPATTKHPPTLLLLYAWGTLYPDKIPMLGNPDFEVQTNRNAMLRFLGGDKMGVVRKPEESFSESFMPRELAFYTADAQDIMDAAGDDLYVAAIVAYDYDMLINKKKKMPLWKTKISCPSTGLALDETLPTMLTIAGPNIGKDTPKPVWAAASEKFKADVQIGDPVVQEFLDSGNLPVIEADKAVRKAPAKKPKTN